MNRVMVKTTLREIRGSLGRYMAILLISALGVGFFTGLKGTYQAMVHTADDYWSSQKLYDYRIVSTLGLDEDAADEFAEEPGVLAAEGSKSADVLAVCDGVEGEFRVMSLPETVNKPDLLAGRLPENSRECIADSHSYGEEALGTTVTISASNDEDTLEQFAATEYTIVGVARSPLFAMYERGTTSIGDGKLDAFLYVSMDAFDTDYLTEVYVVFEKNAGIYTDEYDSLIEEKEDDWEALAERVADDRYDRIYSEAAEEIEDGEAELEEQRADGEAELADAWQELLDGKKEIEDGEAELADARQTIADQRALLQDKEKEYQDGLKSYEDGLKDYEDGVEKYDAGKAEYDDNYSAYEKSLGEYESGYAAYEESEQSYAKALEQFEAGKAYLSEEERVATEQQLAVWRQQLDETAVTLAASKEQLDAAAAALAEAKEQLDATAATLADAKEELDAAKITLDDGKRQIEDGNRQLADAEDEILASEEELAAAREDWEDGNADYLDAKAEFDEKIGDAEQELNDAREELADLEEPKVYLLGRDTNAGYASFDNDAHIILGIAKVFPVFFLLVAALVCMTTMTRMMEEQRTQIGTLKALGYSERSIIGKYLAYSGSAALIGAVSGFFGGSLIFPAVIWQAYKMMYDMGGVHFVFDYELGILATLVALLCSAGTTVFSCHRELREMAASLMRPKPPGNGKRVLMERIPAIWNRLKFLDKVSARNLFRYKKRFFMMIIGVSGCTALLVTALGIRDSISHIADNQFDEIFVYDLEVVASEEPEPVDGVQAALAVSAKSADLYVGGKTKGVNVIVPETWDGFDSYIRMRTEDGETIAPPGKNEAVISSKLAERYDLAVGDEITLKDGDNEGGTLKVSGIFRNFFYHYVIMDASSYGTLFDGELDYNERFVNLEEGVDPAEAAVAFMQDSAVSSVTNTQDTKQYVADMMESLNYVVALVILCAALLGFVVIYNLNNINITERIREIATIKVLGFYKKETNSYVFRENIVLTLLGGLVGLVLGHFLHAFVMNEVNVDALAFDVHVTALSYVISLVFTLVFNQLVNLFMSGKLDAIDMAESLKSVE